MKGNREKLYSATNQATNVIPPLFIRAVPGLGNSLHATGTENESALHNAICASFPQLHPLLCYLHSK